MHKIFISYHHANDQRWKESLLAFGEANKIFIDRSVDTGDISDELDDETIRQKIRDEYLRDSTVTIVLVGQETRKRKHVDWEIYSSMIDGSKNKKSGILVVNLPTAGHFPVIAPHKNEKEMVYPEMTWKSSGSFSEVKNTYPYAPDRIIDNIVKPEALVSVTNWSTCADPKKLELLIEFAYRDRGICEYDLSRPMRRRNSS